VACRFAKCKKPRFIGEEVILPAALDMVNIMVGETAGRLLSKLPVSNNNISPLFQRMTEDVNDQLITKLKGKEFG